MVLAGQCSHAGRPEGRRKENQTGTGQKGGQKRGQYTDSNPAPEGGQSTDSLIPNK